MGLFESFAAADERVGGVSADGVLNLRTEGGDSSDQEPLIDFDFRPRCASPDCGSKGPDWGLRGREGWRGRELCSVDSVELSNWRSFASI